MNILIPVLAFLSVLAMMVWCLLDPSSQIDMMQATIPREARTPPPRYPHFAVIVIFMTGIGFWYTLGAKGVIHFARSADTLHLYLVLSAALFFGANAIWACYWPISFQRRYISQLRRLGDAEISNETKRKLIMSGRCWGVVLLLVSSYLVRSLGAMIP